MKSLPPEDPLDPLLDRWSQLPDPSPRLAAEVWQRLATGRQRAPVERGIWATFGTWLERPVFAACFVAACAALGILLAEARLGRVERERNAQLARNYLEMIDPLVNHGEPPEIRS